MRVLAVLLFAFCLPCEAQVYNLHLVTDNQPDYTDFDSFVESSTRNWKTPEEKAIAVWRWGRRSRHQLSCSREGIRYIMDPILNYNSYGALNCGIISSLNVSSWLRLGFQARYVQLGDHTVSEVSWDNGTNWHMFDSSMSFFCYNHAGQVASCEEIKQAHGCELSGGKVEPGHYYLYHPAPQCASHMGPDAWRLASDAPVEFSRTLQHGAESFTDGFAVDKYCQYSRFGHRYTLNLRPFESYTRYWTPGDNAHIDPKSRSTDYFRPLPNGSDPDGQKNICNLRSNGEWVFEPDLTSPEAKKVFYDAQGIRIAATSPLLRSQAVGSTNWVVFQVSAANIITSMRLEAEAIRAKPSDFLRISVSRNAGIQWQPVWWGEARSEIEPYQRQGGGHAAEAGREKIQLKLRDEVAGGPFCWIKIEMSAAEDPASVGLDSLKFTTTTLVNRLTLPALTLGTNTVQLMADAPAETVELWPFLHGDLYTNTVFEAQDVFSAAEPDGMYKATLGAGVNNKECPATWRVQVPNDVLSVSYTVVATVRTARKWVSLQHSWDGVEFKEFHRHQDDVFPVDRRIEHVFAGGDIPPGVRQAFFRAVFFSESGAATYNMAGIQDLLIRVQHKPRLADAKPFYVTYKWTEHGATGDVTRAHTELVSKLPHRYSVNVAGRRDPTMNWVRIDSANAQPGYSDGSDVGSACEPQRFRYEWGRNMALHRPYTFTRESSTASKNADTEGRELTDGKVIAHTEYMATKEVQPATAFWESGEPVTFVVDLGFVQPISGFKVSTHQPNARYCHPETVEVSVSENGHKWAMGGVIRHDDLWNPPGDYEPWEYDRGWKYTGLPAGGRLAYSFPLALKTPIQGRYVRFVFSSQQDKGLGISELQVFDKVSVTPWPAEIWLPGSHARPPPGGPMSALGSGLWAI